MSKQFGYAYRKGFEAAQRQSEQQIVQLQNSLNKATQQPSFGYRVASNVANQVGHNIGQHIGNKIGLWLADKLFKRPE